MWFISFVIILLGFSVYGFFHSFLASTGVKNWFQTHYTNLYCYYRFFYSIFAVLSLLPIGIILLWLPSIPLYHISTPYIYLTLLIQLIAGFVLAVGIRQTDNLKFLGIKQALKSTSQSEELVTGGLYRYVRHPIYSLGLLVVWLFPLMNSNLFALLIASTGYIIIGAYFEENKLQVTFPEYQQYKQRVPMFFPRIIR